MPTAAECEALHVIEIIDDDVWLDDELVYEDNAHRLLMREQILLPELDTALRVAAHEDFVEARAPVQLNIVLRVPPNRPSVEVQALLVTAATADPSAAMILEVAGRELAAPVSVVPRERAFADKSRPVDVAGAAAIGRLRIRRSADGLYLEPLPMWFGPITETSPDGWMSGTSRLVETRASRKPHYVVDCAQLFDDPSLRTLCERGPTSEEAEIPVVPNGELPCLVDALPAATAARDWPDQLASVADLGVRFWQLHPEPSIPAQVTAAVAAALAEAGATVQLDPTRFAQRTPVWTAADPGDAFNATLPVCGAGTVETARDLDRSRALYLGELGSFATAPRVELRKLEPPDPAVRDAINGHILDELLGCYTWAGVSTKHPWGRISMTLIAPGGSVAMARLRNTDMPEPTVSCSLNRLTGKDIGKDGSFRADLHFIPGQSTNNSTPGEIREWVVAPWYTEL